jgi:transcriptional regulator with XRE-family HTH domain
MMASDIHACLQRRLGRLVTRARRKSGKSQLAIAQGAGVSRVTVSTIERGLSVPSVAVLMAICEQLGVGIGELLEDL